VAAWAAAFGGAHCAGVTRDHNPDNFSLAAPPAVNAGPPGSGAENGALGSRGGASEPLPGRRGGDLMASRIAARQKTLVTTAQLRECGLSDDAVRHRLETGRLHVVFRGVYSMGCGELPPLARELAALLACGERTFVSHRSAAFVWGMIPSGPREVEVSVVGRCCKSRKEMRVHRISAIDRRELRRHEGLWISAPARTLLEIAGTSTPGELADAVTAGVAKRLLTPVDVEAVRKRHAGRRGAARLAAAIGEEAAATITRSQAEKAFWKLIRDARLVRPLANQPLGPYVPDFMWPKERVIVELDSYQFHGGPGAFENDREKDLAYRDAGFDVLRPTRNHVVHQPMRVLAMVVRALARD
jgi:very-short-patch-repair endonuclease